MDADGSLVELVQQPFESEDQLQQLLAKHPEILAGDQVSPGAPRRWLPVTRELSVASEERGSGRWAADHLFLD